MTPVVQRLLLLLLESPALKLGGRVWYLPSLTALGEQNAQACYVGESICLTLTEESLGWWVGVMN